MLCEKCRNREATIHLTEIIKDVKSEVHLCEICAREIGLNSKLSNFSISVPEMLSFLDIEELDNLKDENMCQNCGFTYMDYNRTGKLGCPDCYAYLDEHLRSVIIGYHGSDKHVGKSPDNHLSPLESKDSASAKNDESAEMLQRQLEKAVLEERYEEAAILRDRINDILGGCGTKIG